MVRTRFEYLVQEMKYKEATGNLVQYFSNVKFVNFDIIYNDICKMKLQKSLEEYRRINKNDFDRYDQKLKNEMLSAAYRSECKDIFLRKIQIETIFKKNTLTLNCQQKKKKKKTPADHCKTLSF